ncbi:hypothetical protein RHMOL_Rhmol01G0200400 [Rhododendron molle]|uniref:Uncharacterized protein n=1 Tax=Rhododendron molle TaxID=49168 RepID=A0ACC0Q644_RHOML|nr:hypothetical protein RHMOL_Rhmol01G0200400 [Rhododendron molle]
MKTYSLMSAYLNNEMKERLIWVLDTLKRWMVEKGVALPSVVVSDRDLTLLGALGICFPFAQHILCIWHINQCVMKKCNPMLGTRWDEFFDAWQLIIHSSTSMSLQQRWNAMCREFEQYSNAIQYLWDTWLGPYKERFAVAYINQLMHIGSNSSQRAIAAQIYGSEDEWTQVRQDLIQEIEQNCVMYNQLYPERNYVSQVLQRFRCFQPSTPEDHWMDSISLGLVIVSTYNVVLHTFDMIALSCLTHLSLSSHLVSFATRTHVAFGRVNGNHFVQVFLYRHFLVPPIIIWWKPNESNEAHGWAHPYEARLQVWYEISKVFSPSSFTPILLPEPPSAAPPSPILPCCPVAFEGSALKIMVAGGMLPKWEI